MYIPSHFAQNQADELHRLIQSHPLGTLVTHGAGGLDANPVPFLLDAQDGTAGMLRAHIARANPLWQQARDGDEVLVVFRAHDAYISPNWYPSKHETHRQVPTWNYQVVNVHGRIRVIDDEKFVRGVVGRLTRLHETRVNADAGWRMSDAPREYIDAMLQAVVGIEIEIVRMVGKTKLSQNREARDRHSAAEQLIQHGHQALGDAMRQA